MLKFIIVVTVYFAANQQPMLELVHPGEFDTFEQCIAHAKVDMDSGEVEQVVRTELEERKDEFPAGNVIVGVECKHSKTPGVDI